MKSESQESIERACAFLLTLAMLTVTSACIRVQSESFTPDTLVFEGTLEKLGPDVGFVSGVVAVYRLAKYRVNRVCEGHYEKDEIVVDHLILSGSELKGIELNDHVRVKVRISNKIPSRYDVDGIRNAGEVVDTFYIADGQVNNINGPGGCGN